MSKDLTYDVVDLETTKCAFHPGIYLENWMVIQKVTKRELAERMQVSSTFIDDFICGRVVPTAEMSIKIAKALGMEPTTWLNLRKRYYEKLRELEKKEMGAR